MTCYGLAPPMKIPRLLLAGVRGARARPPDHRAGIGAPTDPRRTRAPIVLIVMENHEYGSIVGSSSAPWLNHTFIPRGTLFTDYHATHHPSLPNYLAMTSGTTSGCRSDECPRATYTTDNLFRQLSRAGIGWVAWMESMPSRCALQSSGKYAVKHNPPAYYATLFPRMCRARDRRYPGNPPNVVAALHVRDAEHLPRHARLFDRRRRPLAGRHMSRRCGNAGPS